MRPKLRGERDGRGEEEDEVEEVEYEGDERVVEARVETGDDGNGEEVEQGQECESAGEDGEIDARGGAAGGLLGGEGR